jgi:hypothetical protein
MNGDRLHEVMDRATDAVAHIGMAAAALATARRRRARRRGVAAGVVSVAAAAAVVVAGQGLAGTPPWDRRPADPASPGPATSSPTSASDSMTFAPPIQAGVIQPVWDPRDVAQSGTETSVFPGRSPAPAPAR